MKVLIVVLIWSAVALSILPALNYQLELIEVHQQHLDSVQ